MAFLDFSKAGLKTFLLISPTMHDKSSIVRFALFFYENPMKMVVFVIIMKLTICMQVH